MFAWNEGLRSVETVWICWVCAATLLAALAARSLRLALRRGARAWLGCERGSAYSMAYVLTLPFAVLLVVMVVECTMILVVKLGTFYAAYCGARAQIVWRAAEPGGRAALRTRQAVVNALVPFAPSGAAVARGMGLPPGTAAYELVDSALYEGAFRAYTGLETHGPYLAAKYHFANHPAITAVVATPGPDDHAAADAPVTVTVVYLRPYYFPWMASMLGGTRSLLGGTTRGFPVTTAATLPDERPRSADGTLGIGYQSD